MTLVEIPLRRFARDVLDAAKAEFTICAGIGDEAGMGRA
jgi:hypothetical protein